MICAVFAAINGHSQLFADVPVASLSLRKQGFESFRERNRYQWLTFLGAASVPSVSRRDTGSRAPGFVIQFQCVLLRVPVPRLKASRGLDPLSWRPHRLTISKAIPKF